MSTYRPRRGYCDEPGPYDWHCTEQALHRYSHYDATEDTSWNERDDWSDEIPHECGTPDCPGKPAPSSSSLRSVPQGGDHQ